jgi:hypothetical protein
MTDIQLFQELHKLPDKELYGLFAEYFLDYRWVNDGDTNFLVSPESIIWRNSVDKRMHLGESVREKNPEHKDSLLLVPIPPYHHSYPAKEWEWRESVFTLLMQENAVDALLKFQVKILKNIQKDWLPDALTLSVATLSTKYLISAILCVLYSKQVKGKLFDKLTEL